MIAVIAALYLASNLGIGDLGPAPFLYSTIIVGAVAFAASFVPAWRASALSPMVAIRNQPESMWRNARLSVRRKLQQVFPGGGTAIVPLGTLIGEFADSVRRADSFAEALRVALATLRERSGAQSITLLEPVSTGELRSESLAISANGVLMNRLRHYPHPLALTRGDFDTWARWAREFRPEHLTEIDVLANSGARMAIPLRTKNDITGVLLLGEPDGRPAFSASEKEMVGSASEVFALMIENARLNERALEQEKIRRDLALAADVQRGLLPPHAPKCAAATLAAFTLPARTVGGDYYDFLPLPEERIGIAVADIAGKGIAAALLTSAVQASLRVILAGGEMDPPRLAGSMNTFLSRASGTNKYATFFYAQFDPRARQLRYVNAGHNPPYLLRRTPSGIETSELAAGGMVLGLFPDVEYTGAQIDLNRGDLLVIFTDGVTEALNPAGEEFGEERLERLLRESLGGSADAISSALASGLRAWIAGAEQYDDLTFVVVAMN
jgi:phosphoserine phosphatase RsbU/P